MTARIALLLVLLAAAPVSAADELRAVATPSKTDVSVGELFAIDVKATGPAGASFAFPSEAVHEDFELHSAPEGEKPLPAGTHRYLARVFALGEAHVPPIPVGYKLSDGTSGEVRTDSLTLRVTSLLPKEESEQKLADVRGPVSLPIGRTFWIAVGAFAAVIAGAIAWLVMRKRRVVPVAAVAVKAMAPDDEARRALDALAATDRLARGEHRLYYIDLTTIAKRYLERRLAAPIVEMTTAEMLSYLKATSTAAELVPTLRDLAGAADQIKFARGEGLNEEAQRHMSATRAMIETLEARLRPAAPAGGQAA
jgi:hypothetical protein